MRSFVNLIFFHISLPTTMRAATTTTQHPPTLTVTMTSSQEVDGPSLVQAVVELAMAGTAVVAVAVAVMMVTICGHNCPYILVQPIVVHCIFCRGPTSPTHLRYQRPPYLLSLRHDTNNLCLGHRWSSTHFCSNENYELSCHHGSIVSIQLHVRSSYSSIMQRLKKNALQGNIFKPKLQKTSELGK